MNNRDRKNILSILEGIANTEPSSFLNAGFRILRDHPKIADMMESTTLEYWEAMNGSEKIKTGDVDI